MKIYVFGNNDLDNDNSGIKLSKILSNHFKDIEFIYISDINSFSPNEKVPILLDSASNISEVIVIESTDKLQTNMNTSNHDFDLGMTLKLLMKLHKIEGFKAICVPQTISEKDILVSIKVISQL
jgi:hypothetical protein